MGFSDRTKQFRNVVKELPQFLGDNRAKLAENFGFSNSARVIEGGLFACTNNLATYSRRLASEPAAPRFEQFMFLCVLSFPPQDEVYFVINVTNGAGRLNDGLTKLYREGEAENERRVQEGLKPSSISNNVKFYITDEGNLFFHNSGFEGMDAPLNDAAIDPDYKVSIDEILYSVWPPQISARRGLLAREFVGYLGGLIGTRKVREIKAWEEASPLSPGMRRMPKTIPVGEIEDAIDAMGGYYPGGEVRRLHASLNFHDRKHFVILAGLSGSGKTQLARFYAKAVHGLTDRAAKDPLLYECPVRPEWTDPSELTGYLDVLSGKYIVPTFLEAVLVAIAHAESPVFVILDEMNLARVEYYLSDVLSVMELGEDGRLRLHSEDVPPPGPGGTSVIGRLPLPPNLFLIGTINIDETTNPISDKVLDRASVISMSSIQLDGYLARLADDNHDLAAVIGDTRDILVSTNELLAQHNLAFGYRVANEVIQYLAFATQTMGAGLPATLDDLMVQKVLVKLRGTERQRPLLTGLQDRLVGLEQSQDLLARMVDELDKYSSFQATR